MEEAKMNLDSYPVELSVQPDCLTKENKEFRNTAGTSGGNHAYGFLPAFLDKISGEIYISCFSNGKRAPIHLYEGLPDSLVTKRDKRNRAIAVHKHVISGFFHERRFYTREQTIKLVKRIKNAYAMKNIRAPIPAFCLKSFSETGRT